MGVSPVALAGLPGGVADLIGYAGAIVLLLILAAIAGIVYRHVTGGIEWPDEREADEEEGARRAEPDDEWDYY